ncbi:MAG TPA: winged helix-turn-helix domain-containing protein [Pyrinomonadaceae bacterium]|nr:winged helix-turn-helix domain-containing protein [Pyrinomonadaceae bacterium]
MPHNLCYEFGPYHLNVSKRVLTCAGETIALTLKATEILGILVTNAGQVVEKDELLKEVWPDTFVEEANLSQNVFTLRKALRDEHGDPRYIETVPRRGYRFIASVRAVAEECNGEDVRSASAEIQLPVVAVLPFLNSTEDLDWEYLADGLTDNLINNLSRVSKLRVMSHSAVARFKAKDVDPQQAGNELGSTVVLVGKLNLRNARIVIGVELVDASTGWQLWGESFDSESQDILGIQDAITRQVLAALKLELTGEEEKRVTARYTENSKAYQSYLEGRYHWSKYTRTGINKAIGHFRHAISLDPNYALAYSAIVDCYLRLATNYLPPENDLPTPSPYHPQSEPDPRIKLRFEWEWKTVERELRRANELKTNYPSAHQWYVAYQISKQFYRESLSHRRKSLASKDRDSKLKSQIPSVQLTPTEEVQILCAVARDQIASGNYDAANLMLRRWSTEGKWPRLDCLNPYAAADLLFTLGTLLAGVASTRRVTHGQKHAEIFLSGSIALFEQLGIKTRSVEARIELARCYYWQGMFDTARSMLSDALSDLPEDEPELKTLCLALWGAVERDSGRLVDAAAKLREAMNVGAIADSLTARCYHELAITLKDLMMSEGVEDWAAEAKLYFEKTLYVCEAIGNHRQNAAADNNFGFLLLSVGAFEAAEHHLLRSKRFFACLSDRIREAQVKETLARLYLKTKQYDAARDVIHQAVGTLEETDGEALLAEAMTTAGIVAAKQGRLSHARKSLEGAYQIAERCGDEEGAGRALLVLLEEVGDFIESGEKIQVAERLKRLLRTTQRKELQIRVQKCIDQVVRETTE